MAEKKPEIYLYSNNPEVKDYFLGIESEIYNLQLTENKNSYYLLLLLDLNSDLTDLTSKILNFSDLAVKQSKKILFSFLLSSDTNPEMLNKYLNLISEFREKKLDYRCLVIYDLYTFNTKSPVTTFDALILKTISNGSILASKKGDSEKYPLSLGILLEAIKKILYLNSTSFKTYFLSGTSLSDIENAYTLKKYYEEYFKADFDIETANIDKHAFLNKQQVSSTLAELGLRSGDTYFDDLKKYISDQASQIIQTKQQTVSNQRSTSFFQKKINKIKNFFVGIKTKEKKSQNLNRWALVTLEKVVVKTLFIASLIFLVSSIIFVCGSYYALKSLESAHFYLKKGDLFKTNHHFKRADISHKVSSYNFAFIAPVMNLVSKDIADQSQKVLSFIDFADIVFENIIQTYSLAEKTYNSLNNVHNLNYQSTFLALQTNFQQIYESLNQLEILINDKDLPKPLTDAIKNNQEFKNLSLLKENLWEASKILEVMPSFLGENKNSNVFLLVQNNSEIRPTGGVIDYVYHLSLEKGRLVFSKSYTPQEIDDLSDQKILPPPLVEKVTGSEEWRLRDMNYNPDFSQTSVNITWYLESKLKTKPDFVVGLNTSVLLKFLENSKVQSSLGNKYSPMEYKKGLSTGNSSQTTKNIVDDLIKLTFDHQIPALETFETLLSEVDNLSLWASDKNLQSVIFSQPLSKNVNKKSCLPGMSSARVCHQETIHLNYSNFSSIPLNNYLSKRLSVKVFPQALNLDHQIEIETSYTEQTPLINRNLVEIVQFYINKSSALTKVQINDEVIGQDQIQTQIEGDLARHQFVVSTPLNQTNLLKIEYSTPMTQRTVLPIAYSYSIIPQPGFKFSKKLLEVSLPQNSRVSAITSPAESQPDSLVVDLTDKNSFGFNLVAR